MGKGTATTTTTIPASELIIDAINLAVAANATLPEPPASETSTGLDRATVVKAARPAVKVSHPEVIVLDADAEGTPEDDDQFTASPTRRPRFVASRWSRTSKTTYDVTYDGDAYNVRKLGDGVWKMFRWVAEGDDGDWREVEGVTGTGIRAIWNAVRDWTHAQHDAYVAVHVGPEPQPARPVALDYCPTCGATGDAPCRTKTGKVVKENGGRHAARTGDLVAPVE